MKGAAISTPITDRAGHRSAIAKVSAPVPQPTSSSSPDAGNSTKSRNTAASRRDHRPSQNSYAAPSLARKFDGCDDMLSSPAAARPPPHQRGGNPDIVAKVFFELLGGDRQRGRRHAIVHGLHIAAHRVDLMTAAASQ